MSVALREDCYEPAVEDLVHPIPGNKSLISRPSGIKDIGRVRVTRIGSNGGIGCSLWMMARKSLDQPRLRSLSVFHIRYRILDIHDNDKLKFTSLDPFLRGLSPSFITTCSKELNSILSINDRI